MPVCYLGIGSNLGNREENIAQAIEKVRQLPDTAVVKVSSLIETDPQGGPQQGLFLNAAMEIKTQLSPHQLLSALQKIENDLGRVRVVKNGPRTIDLDILLYDNLNLAEADLVIPHPRMKERDFVLRPLREIAPLAAEKLLHENN
jgi:2-amino-4-hydroxy-6-hydroxymethyldihydropteridine diphosphokinase